MITRRSLLKNAGAAAFVSACGARAGWSAEAETKAPAAQKITKIEPFILRSPPERGQAGRLFHLDAAGCADDRRQGALLPA